MAKKRKFLGELLVEAGAITKEQRDKALLEQKRLGKRLGDTLISLGYVTEDNMIKALSSQLALQFKELKTITISPDVINIIPEAIARKHRVLPIEVNDKKITLAMADPLDVFAVDEVKRITNMSVDMVIAAESELLMALDRYYKGEAEEARKIAEGGYAPDEERVVTLESAPDDTPVVRLVNAVIAQAIKDRASDIHIESYVDSLRVRFRIDGMLHEVMKPAKHLHQGVVARVKIVSGMDIAEKRVPQDGRFTINLDARQFDIRASTLPTLYGEKIVLRLLEKTAGLPELAALGFTDDVMYRSFEGLISRPYGFLLATGPTGCGKTTTMYSSLNTISTTERNIITVEDPVEYNLKDINQVQVNPKAGLTFASGLRAILRQDPDVIMIGEIRDLETASIATHSALTGHLVLSTLHTNEAVGAIARLVDMGVEPFLITSSLIGVLGQRLIRKICPHCKEGYTTSQEIFKEIGMKDEILLHKGKGCNECRFTGYLGREGLFELLLIGEGIKRLIVDKSPASVIKAYAQKEGFRTMRQEGLRKAVKGITTIEEVMRVTLEAGE